MVVFSSSRDMQAASRNAEGFADADGYHCNGLSVNAAFLQEVKDDNRQFVELKQKVRDVLAAEPQVDVDLSMIANLLTQFRDQLARHFRLEERLGYLEDAVNVAPRLSRRAERLLGDHEVLYKRLCAITAEAERGVSLPRSQHHVAFVIRDRFQRFCVELEQHEKGEDDLIIESLYFDIGGVG